MGEMTGEPLYCPLCGTLPSAIEDQRRICPSCDLSMKDLVWLMRDDLKRLRELASDGWPKTDKDHELFARIDALGDIRL